MSPEDGELMPKHHDFKVLEICRSNAQRGELKPFYPSASRRTLPRLAPGGRPRGLDPIDAPFRPLETIRPDISSYFCHQWSVVATRFYSPVSRKCPATMVACVAMAQSDSVSTRPAT